MKVRTNKSDTIAQTKKFNIFGQLATNDLDIFAKRASPKRLDNINCICFLLLSTC